MSSRCEPTGVTSSNNITHSAPSRRARSSRSRASSLPCSRVISRCRWQNAASRTASRSMNESSGGGEREIASRTSSRRSLQAVTRSSSVRTSPSSSATARTTPMYSWYSSALTITDG